MGGPTGARRAVKAQEEQRPPCGPLEEAWSIFDECHLPYRLLMLGKALDRISAQQLRDLVGLTLAEWRVIVHLSVMGSRSASQVSAAALVDRAEVSRAVRSLEASGYVKRVDNPRNRKSSLLLVTPEGFKIYERLQQQRRDFYEDLLVDIDPAELVVLDELLLRIARRADVLARESNVASFGS